jgi:hypothetical protein
LPFLTFFRPAGPCSSQIGISAPQKGVGQHAPFELALSRETVAWDLLMCHEKKKKGHVEKKSLLGLGFGRHPEQDPTD